MTRKEEIEQAAEDYYNEVKYLSDLSAFPIAAFKAGAEWSDRTMLDRVCEWIETNTNEINLKGGICLRSRQFIEELKQAMEE